MGLAVREQKPILGCMTRSWLRRRLASILGVVFAASMSVSAVQATEMAAGMTIGSTMGVAASDGKCPDCDHGSHNAKASDCLLAICGGTGVAMLASTFVVAVRTDGIALLPGVQSLLIGWACPPDPYPPRLRTLG